MTDQQDQQRYTAAIIVVGNEILSGRTQDKNTQWIAERLALRGVTLREARVIPDKEAAIVKTVNELRARETYVFTTGGIGPTHDDITAASVARAFGVEFKRNDEAYKALLDYYGPEELTEARERMALIPAGASLIPNPVSGAPGFIMDNVHVMAGVPRIMQAMLDHVLEGLRGGALVLSNTITCALPESVIAKALAELQSDYKMVEIGSYPHFKLGALGVSVVLRCTQEGPLKAATRRVLNILAEYDVEPQAVSYQVPID